MTLELVPWLTAMGILIGVSAFFSCSEAALFLLTPQDLRIFAAGSRAQQTAARLLALPDRLLSAVLFGNLVVNLTYFGLSSVWTIRLQMSGHHWAAGVLALGSVLALIVVGESLPKSVAVVQPRLFAAWLSLPLAPIVAILDRMSGVFRLTLLMSQRLFWPHFKPEPYLELADLERAVELSTSDASLLEQEKTVLQNIVALSEIRVEEVMRPRLRYRCYRPPVSLADLEGQMPTSGYVLVTEPENDEVAGAIPLGGLANLPREHLEYFAEDVPYVPWCATAGETLDLLRNRDRSVAAVVNELGETIGIVTLDDIFDTVFRQDASRSQRLLKRQPIEPLEDGAWRVTGMTTLRRLAREFEVELPHTQAVTVSGVLQEVLERLPLVGDRCRWGPFALEVLGIPDHGQLLVRLSLADQQPPEEAA